MDVHMWHPPPDLESFCKLLLFLSIGNTAVHDIGNDAANSIPEPHCQTFHFATSTSVQHDAVAIAHTSATHMSEAKVFAASTTSGAM